MQTFHLITLPPGISSRPGIEPEIKRSSCRMQKRFQLDNLTSVKMSWCFALNHSFNNHVYSNDIHLTLYQLGVAGPGM